VFIVSYCHLGACGLLITVQPA